MPGRKVPLVSGEYYHIYNRGVAKMTTFFDPLYYSRFIELIRYYQSRKTGPSYSVISRLPKKELEEIVQAVRSKRDFLVRIHSFKLMPNHFHFTLEQLVDKGISTFMSQVENSYTKFVNKKRDRVGSLFQGKFKAVHIETPEQLIHLSRYHHLNALTSAVVKTFKELETYPYSSFPDYLGIKLHDFVETDTVLADFKDHEAYRRFVACQSEYQRKLHTIKHLLLENA